LVLHLGILDGSRQTPPSLCSDNSCLLDNREHRRTNGAQREGREPNRGYEEGDNEGQGNLIRARVDNHSGGKHTQGQKIIRKYQG